MQAHKFTFISQKNIIFSFNKYTTDTNAYFFTVNHLSQFYFITSHIKNNYCPITFISPQNAVAYMGVRWWMQLIKFGKQLFSNPTDDALDCYDNAGLALAALRLGQKKILFNSKSKQFNLLKNRAESRQATILTKRSESFDLTELRFSYF